MSCPPMKHWALVSSGAMDHEKVEQLAAHAETCRDCAARLDRATADEPLLAALYEPLSRDHQVQRNRLQERLAWEPIPSRVQPTPRIAWRRAATWMLPAAALLGAILVFFPHQESLFAAAIDQLNQAETIVCRVTTDHRPSTDAPERALRLSEEKLSLAFAGGSRQDTYVDGRLTQTVCTTSDGGGVIIDASARTYFTTDDVEVEVGAQLPSRTLESRLPAVHFMLLGGDPERLLRGMRALSTEPDRELGRTLLHGRDCIGYEIDGRRVGMVAPWVDPREENRAELWIDESTGFPVQLVFEWVLSAPSFSLGPDQSFVLRKVYEHFEWNRDLPASLFDPPAPEGYERLSDASFLVSNLPGEAEFISALRHFADHSGRYPKSLNLLSLSSEIGSLAARLEAQRTTSGVDDDAAEPLDVEALSGLGWFILLEVNGQNPEYHGDRVHPGDRDQVLMRWTSEDGASRCLYGDLRADADTER